MRIPALCSALAVSLLLSGCSLNNTATTSTPATGRSIHGNVHGGQQPISGSHVYLFRSDTTAYGNASVSLLNSSAAGAATDSIGTYVTTDANGNFSITGDYTCTAGDQAYLYALGGNPGAGPNSAAGLMAVLGTCPASGNFSGSVPFVSINEVTTVAAAYAFLGFASDPTHVASSGTPLAKTGIANAFATASNLANIATGTAYTTTPGGNGSVPQADINTLANILSACINSTGPSSTACSSLFNYAPSGGNPSTTPTDTAMAAINIAHNPLTNVANLYSLVPPSPPFNPSLTSAPSDFIVSIAFNGGGINGAQHLAIDGSGNIWTTNNTPSLSKFSPLGVALSPAGGYTDSSLNSPTGIAIDTSGNVWAANNGGNTISGFTNSGTFITGASSSSPTLNTPSLLAFDPTGRFWVPTLNGSVTSLVQFSSAGAYNAAYTGGGLNHGSLSPIAFDPAGNAWVGNAGTTGFSVFSSAGVASPSSPISAGGVSSPVGMAFDSSSNLWFLNSDGSFGAITSAGTAVPGSPVNTGSTAGIAMAIDGKSHAWFMTSTTSGSTTTYTLQSYKISSGSITYAGGTTFSFPGAPLDLAFDGSGNIWLLGSNKLIQLIGVTKPVVTPLSYAVANNSLGTRP
ncbi:NHL repeat-containing protein [Edaphobacter bradus]|uniref:hypothetical protein n=1 Tax=Edaphobacter bradus TaxID=2259016 RepID=UPI0021E0D26D|nr:hypothetical protein [Edaphobacter bradus]